MALGRWAPYRFPWSNVSNVFFWELLELFHANTQRFHPGIPQQGRPLTGPRGFRLSQKKGVGKGELKWINQQTPHRIHGNGIFANIYLTKSAKCRNILHTLILWASKRQGFVASGVSFLVFFFRLLKFCGLKACGEIETTSYSIRYIWWGSGCWKHKPMETWPIWQFATANHPIGDDLTQSLGHCWLKFV